MLGRRGTDETGRKEGQRKRGASQNANREYKTMIFSIDISEVGIEEGQYRYMNIVGSLEMCHRLEVSLLLAGNGLQ